MRSMVARDVDRRGSTRARSVRMRTTSILQPHPEAGSGPAMSELEFTALRADVAEHGVLEPLPVTKDGLLIDGHHRLRAALELGIARVPARVVEPPDPLASMLRSALQRRPLYQSQKACLAVELVSLQQAGGQVATLPLGGRSRDLIARTAVVSPRTAQDVLTVHARDRELFEQIKGGQ